VKLRWTANALHDLEHLYAYIARDNRAAADRYVDTAVRFPESGRLGTRVDGTRELVIHPFLVVYRCRLGTLEVLAIIHGCRKWP
jgi:toxin ParE1/3/4